MLGPRPDIGSGPKGVPLVPLSKLDHHHRLTVTKIFGHPLSRNIQWHDVESLLERIVIVSISHRGNVNLTMNGETHSLGKVRGHDLSEDQVIRVRHILKEVGIVQAAA